MKKTSLSRYAANAALGVFTLASTLMTMNASAQNTKAVSDNERHLKVTMAFDMVGYPSTNSHYTNTKSNTDVMIKGFKWTTQPCPQYYNLAEGWRQGNPLKVFDEPSNEYMFSWEGPKDFIFISADHNKNKQLDQIDRIVGKVNGIQVDHMAPLYSWENKSPDQLQIINNENANWLEQIELGYGRILPLFKSKKLGRLTYKPAVSAGIQVGINRSVEILPSGETREYKEDPTLQGFGASLRNKLEWATKNDAFGIFYENCTSLYHCKHGLLGGTQEYNLISIGNQIGLKFNPPHIGRYVRSHIHL